MKKSNLFKAALCLGVVVSLMGTMKTGGVTRVAQANLGYVIGGNGAGGTALAGGLGYAGGYCGAILGAAGGPIGSFFGGVAGAALGAY
jgi:hypothetical protein